VRAREMMVFLSEEELKEIETWWNSIL